MNGQPLPVAEAVRDAAAATKLTLTDRDHSPVIRLLLVTGAISSPAYLPSRYL